MAEGRAVAWVAVQAPRCAWEFRGGDVAGAAVAGGVRGAGWAPAPTWGAKGKRMDVNDGEGRAVSPGEATEIVVRARHRAWVARPRAEAHALETPGSMQDRRAAGAVGVTGADLAKVTEATREVTQGNAG